MSNTVVTPDLARLKDPFPPEDIEWRVQRSGERDGKPWAMVLAYVNNRAIMERLDSICGPHGWYNEYKAGPNGGIVCGLSILTANGWITKWDGADNTQIEPVKGGLSDSMKRAAVQWGIGRYLYNLDAAWANVNDHGKHRDKIKDSGKWFKWDAPELPGWALPDGYRSKTSRQNDEKPPQGRDEHTTGHNGPNGHSEWNALVKRMGEAGKSLPDGEKKEAFRREYELVKESHDTAELRSLVERMEAAAADAELETL